MTLVHRTYSCCLQLFCEQQYRPIRLRDLQVWRNVSGAGLLQLRSRVLVDWFTTILPEYDVMWTCKLLANFRRRFTASICRAVVSILQKMGRK
jgi:hypothetical protein